MSIRTPSWDHLRAFQAVMAATSLSGAARALGLAQPTVRRQIEALEAELGVVLFTRSPAGLKPTDAARDALPLAQAMAAAADALARGASSGKLEARGVVRLTCSEVVGAEVLPSMIPALLAAHPGLELEAVPTNATQDLLRRDADLAVRMTRPIQAALIARKVGTIPVGLFASPSYLSRRPPPQTPADLARDHVLIGEDRGPGLAAHLRAISPDLADLRFAYRSDSDLAQLGAVRAGVGIGACQLALAGPDLVRVLPDFTAGLETWIVMHEDLRADRRVSTVFDHLVEGFAAYARRA
jgi:DNA-binding transcriptional LysR family regulator